MTSTEVGATEFSGATGINSRRQRLSSKQVPELDGVRGLAVLLVLIVHFVRLVPRFSTVEYLMLKVAAPMWCGVTLFFVLSGFLITGILLDTRDCENYFSAFYGRRFLRIFPLYYAFIFGAIAVLGISNISRADLASYFLYVYNWRAAFHPGAKWSSHLWSLAVEEQFYLLWPLVVYYVSPKRFSRVLLGLIVCSIFFRVGMLWIGSPLLAYGATPSHIDELCLGALGAWMVRTKTLEYSNRVLRGATIAGSLLVVLTLATAKGYEGGKGMVLSAGASSLSFLFFVLVTKAHLHAGAGSLPYMFLRMRPLMWLGKYGYGIYVLHNPISIYLTRLFYGPVITKQPSLMARLGLEISLIIVGIGLSCGAAYLVYEYFEKMFLRLKPAYKSPKESAEIGADVPLRALRVIS